ncbi:hypothetical protein ACIQ9P_01315 [Kitasatospora sp. NPDC094019]|uniref:hypothetical protein n=1 Tax=Kitasatospora sp. NPDC094019 TaxID=3364091 RepID=UPI003816DE50
MAIDSRPAPGPRLGRGRVVGLLVIAPFTAAAGWLVATGFVRAYATGACGPEHSCGSLSVAACLTAGIPLWLLALVAAATTAHGDAPTTEPSATSDRGVLAGCLALGLLGAALADGTPRPWLLAPVLPLALLTAALDRRGARRWHAHRSAPPSPTGSPADPLADPPADAAPSTPEFVLALERLTALHREGALDAAEFAAAKARLLGTGISAGANGGL